MGGGKKGKKKKWKKYVEEGNFNLEKTGCRDGLWIPNVNMSYKL